MTRLTGCEARHWPPSEAGGGAVEKQGGRRLAVRDERARSGRSGVPLGVVDIASGSHLKAPDALEATKATDRAQATPTPSGACKQAPLGWTAAGTGGNPGWPAAQGKRQPGQAGNPGRPAARTGGNPGRPAARTGGSPGRPAARGKRATQAGQQQPEQAAAQASRQSEQAAVRGSRQPEASGGQCRQQSGAAGSPGQAATGAARRPVWAAAPGRAVAGTRAARQGALRVGSSGVGQSRSADQPGVSASASMPSFSSSLRTTRKARPSA